MMKNPWFKSICLAAHLGTGLALQAGCGAAPLEEEDSGSLQHQTAALQDTVSATNVSIYIFGNKATGSYTYNSTANAAQSGSQYTWQRSSSSSGSSPTPVATTNNWYITPSDNTAYLRFCVTPASQYATGSQVCSSWTSVGHILELYKDSNTSGTNVNLAYEASSSGACINLTDSSFNDVLTSFKFHALSSYPVKLVLYQDINCSGSSQSYSYAAGYDATQNSLSSGWNDAVTSVRLAWNTTVSVSNVALSISGVTATPTYTYTSSNNLPDASIYAFFRASDSSGTGSSALTSTTTAWSLQPADNNQYLRVCVTASDGFSTAPQVCSSWSWVGHLMNLYKDRGLGGSHISIAYELSPSGTCFNLTDYSFNDVVSSWNVFAMEANAINTSTFKNVNCSHSSSIDGWHIDAGKSTGENMEDYGLNSNDILSSVKVYW